MYGRVPAALKVQELPEAHRRAYRERLLDTVSWQDYARHSVADERCSCAGTGGNHQIYRA